MLETLALGFGAALVLLVLDQLLRTGANRDAGSRSGPRLLLGARVIALFLLAGTLVTHCRQGELADDLRWMALFGLCGFALFELAIRVGSTSLRGLQAAAQADNLAAATAIGAHVVAVGILLASVCYGHDHESLGLAAASFVVGQGTLLALVALFRVLTAYDDRAQMLAGNLAAALAHGGLTIALALVIARATDGEYQGAWPALRDYGIAVAEGLLVWPLRQLLVQCVILRAAPTLRAGELDRAIGERGDVGAGALEAATYLAVAFFVVQLP